MKMAILKQKATELLFVGIICFILMIPIIRSQQDSLLLLDNFYLPAFYTIAQE